MRHAASDICASLNVVGGQSTHPCACLAQAPWQEMGRRAAQRTRHGPRARSWVLCVRREPVDGPVAAPP